MMARPRTRRVPVPAPDQAATLTTLFYVTSAVLVIVFVFSLTGHLPDGDSFVSSASPLWPHWTQPTSFLQSQHEDRGNLRIRGLRRLPIQSGALLQEGIWSSEYSRYFRACSDPSSQYNSGYPPSQSNGYLVIETSGGLNQQRIGITDAVVVARFLNATLVIPELDHDSFWNDKSDFGDLFDVEWFIKTLSRDVQVVKEVPRDVATWPSSMRVPRRSKPSFYAKTVLPVLRERQVVRLTKFDFRLANTVEEGLQKLRCRVNYHALQFTGSISSMGRVLVERMRSKGKGGRYIALHLRFEPDMLAFSGCYYGGGEAEIQDLGSIRKRWKNLRDKNPEQQRRNGKCPLSPLEVGLMLKALGFDSQSYLYVASGEVYGGERTLAPLKSMFPNFFTKDMLASKNELLPFAQHTSQLAAIDYIVCDESDVFVTNNNGNMAQILAGRRRYFGHKRTIRPNARKLGQLFLERQNLTSEVFAKKLQSAQRGFMGEPMEVRPGKGGFYEYPAACICEAFSGAQEQMETALEARAAAKKAGKKSHQGTSSTTDELEEAAAEQMQLRDPSEENYDLDVMELDRVDENESF